MVRGERPARMTSHKSAVVKSGPPTHFIKTNEPSTPLIVALGIFDGWGALSLTLGVVWLSLLEEPEERFPPSC